jgi:hypothetical protein
MGLKKMFFSQKSEPQKYIFIVGTGRSGTHLLARSLASSQLIDANIEDSKFFKMLTNAAIHRTEIKENDILKLINDYKSFLSSSEFKLVLDKTHPNLWLIDLIDKVIDNAYFIGIKRNAYSTINSMLKHEGVLSWYNKIDLEKSNKFLGINEENKSYFKNLPLESKCALRWKSHNDELSIINNSNSNFLLIDYEEFYKDGGSLKLKINKFLDENLDIVIENLNQDGHTKWKDSLNKDQIKNIDKVLNF